MTLPLDITVSAVAEPFTGANDTVQDVDFRVPYGDVSIGGDSTQYGGVDFKIEKDDKYYHICVHSIGLVEELGFHDNDDDLVCEFGI